MDVDTFIKRNVLLCLLMIESEIKKKISKQLVSYTNYFFVNFVWVYDRYMQTKHSYG